MNWRRAVLVLGILVFHLSLRPGNLAKAINIANEHTSEIPAEFQRIQFSELPLLFLLTNNPPVDNHTDHMRRVLERVAIKERDISILSNL